MKIIPFHLIAWRMARKMEEEAEEEEKEEEVEEARSSSKIIEEITLRRLGSLYFVIGNMIPHKS